MQQCTYPGCNIRTKQTYCCIHKQPTAIVCSHEGCDRLTKSGVCNNHSDKRWSKCSADGCENRTRRELCRFHDPEAVQNLREKTKAYRAKLYSERKEFMKIIKANQQGAVV